MEAGRRGPDRRPELFERAARAFNESDFAALDSMVANGIVSHVTPALANSGDWQGRRGFHEMIRGWTEPWSSITMQIREYELIDERRMLARVLQQAVGAGSGVPVELTVYFAVEVVDLRLVRFEVHADRAAALAALASD